MQVLSTRFGAGAPYEQFEHHSPTIGTHFTSTERKKNNPDPSMPRYELQDMLGKAQQVSAQHQVRVKVRVLQDLGTYYYYPDGKGGAQLGSTGSAPPDRFEALFSTAKGTSEQNYKGFEALRHWAETLYPAIDPSGGGGHGNSWIA